MHGLDPGPLTVDAAREPGVDEVALALLRTAAALPGVARVGLALTRGAGRELAFTANDRDNESGAGIDWCTIDGMADVPLTQAVRRRAAIYLPDVTALCDRYPHMADRQVALGTRALAACPLVHDDAVLGGVLLMFDRPQPFGDDQQEALLELTRRTAEAFAVAHGRSRSVALTAHGRGPETLPSPRGVQLGQHHGLYGTGLYGTGLDGTGLDRTGLYGTRARAPGVAPRRSGTGWVDALDLPDGGLLLAAGWRSDDGPDGGGGAGGRDGGLDAGLDAGAPARRALRSLVDAGAVDPGAVLAGLGGDAAVVVVLDAAGRRACVASAGGPQAVVGGAGPPRALRSEEPAASTLPVPGASRAARTQATAVDLTPGSFLVLVSDPQIDPHALAAAVAALAPGSPDPLRLALELGQHPGLVTDAASSSVLVARLPDGGSAHRMTLELPDDATAPRLARRSAVAQLDCWGAGDVADAVEACVSELCTNALMHSATGARLVLAVADERVTVLVQNGGAGRVERAGQDDDGVGGRGLMLVEALSSRWGWAVGAEGTTVWCELDRPFAGRAE